MANTIIAGDVAPSDSPEFLNTGTITSLGNNLIGDSAGDSTSTHTAIVYQPSDIRDTPPHLGALLGNGGQTPTLALLAGSPAIDAGSIQLAVDPSNPGTPLSVDQRGYTRVIGANVDIGAFEFNSNPADLTVSGKVTMRNRGAPRVMLTLTAGDGSSTTTITNPFGYYRFRNAKAGEFYTLTATSKQATFATQMIYVSGDIADLNFSEM